MTSFLQTWRSWTIGSPKRGCDCCCKYSKDHRSTRTWFAYTSNLRGRCRECLWCCSDCRISAISGTCKLNLADRIGVACSDGLRAWTMISAALAMASKMTWSHLARGPDALEEDDIWIILVDRIAVFVFQSNEAWVHVYLVQEFASYTLPTSNINQVLEYDELSSTFPTALVLFFLDTFSADCESCK